MPWTFAHPVAVLPLRRFCPAQFNFAALAIGALTPDFGFYVNLFSLATDAHTLLGSFLVCLPTGLVLLACGAGAGGFGWWKRRRTVSLAT